MARRLLAAFVAVSMTLLGQIYTAQAQDERDLGQVRQSFLCTEAGILHAFQALTVSPQKIDEAIMDRECIQGPPSFFRIVNVLAGPVPDYEGDTMLAVEVWGSRDTPKRFTIAWPGFNAPGDLLSPTSAGQGI